MGVVITEAPEKVIAICTVVPDCGTYTFDDDECYQFDDDEFYDFDD